MPSGKLPFYFPCLLFLFIFYACESPMDIYARVPRNSKLSEELLRDALQIYPYKEGLMILYDSDPSVFNADYYLLFFDSSSILEGAAYLSSSGVVDFDGINIKSYKDPLYDERKPLRIDHIPERFRIEMMDCLPGMANTQNKQINSFELVDSENPDVIQLKMNISEGKDSYYSQFHDLTIDSLNLKSKDISLDLREIYFMYDQIFTFSCSDEGLGIRRDHYFFQPNLKEELYTRVFDYLIKNDFKIVKGIK